MVISTVQQYQYQGEINDLGTGACNEENTNVHTAFVEKS
jgi:hypothetical protein